MRHIAAATLLLTLIACNAQPSPEEQRDTTERAAMTPLKDHYPDVVMGFDFHGNTLDMSVDPNGEMDLDDSKDAAMKAEALRRWRAAWMQTHPGAHGTLTVRVIDFRGTLYWKGTVRA